MTGDGRAFGRLRSHDLVEGEELRGAMRPLTTAGPLYWAPEVTYYNGRFYLYYSVGNETFMEIRVAMSDSPDGDFVDAGRKVTFQDFAIDQHVFRDEDGAWWMFYATDFLNYSHIGTGTVVDRMLDPMTLAGDPKPVTRAKYDWQVYDPHRKEKGGVRWHTVEGPFVLKRKGRYYEMFSGGNWKEISYGVSFAVTDDISRDREWRQYSDGVKTLPLLRTIPKKVIGPGHNSVVHGPNNRELYCVYHRWIDDERALAIDRMDFTGGERMFVAGPTVVPQMAPFAPQVSDDFKDLATGPRKITSGRWSTAAGEIVSESAGTGEIVYETGSHSFLSTVGLRCFGGTGQFGIGLRSTDGEMFRFAVVIRDRDQMGLAFIRSGQTLSLEVPGELDFRTTQELRLEVDGRHFKLSAEGIRVPIDVVLSAAPSEVFLFADGARAAFSAFRLTRGFEELFENKGLDERGWTIAGSKDGIAFQDKFLLVTSEDTKGIVLSKAVSPGDFELAINMRVETIIADNAAITFGCGTSIKLRKTDVWVLEAGDKNVALPAGYNAKT